MLHGIVKVLPINSICNLMSWIFLGPSRILILIVIFLIVIPLDITKEGRILRQRQPGMIILKQRKT